MKAIARVREGDAMGESGKPGDQFGRKDDVPPGGLRLAGAGFRFVRKFTNAGAPATLRFFDMNRGPARRWRFAAAALLVLGAGFAAAQAPKDAAEEARRAEAARLLDELNLGTGVGGDFTLADSRGHKRRLSDFRGKIVVLYFGFTTCPDICPTDLLEIGKALRYLGARQAKSIQPIFVTLDPLRDKPAVIAEYVKNFHPSFLGLTGTPAQIAEVARAYKVFYAKVPIQAGAGYTLDHSAFTYVIDRRGAYVAFLPPGTSYDRIARLLHTELLAAP
jgi:cytochrome oxidase Cu insertion factor (SCO1/SenC/PrrC family)